MPLHASPSLPMRAIDFCTRPYWMPPPSRSHIHPSDTPVKQDCFARLESRRRRSVLLVLHDTAQPWMTSKGDWTPKGLCPR